MSGAPDINDRHIAGALPDDLRKIVKPLNAKAEERQTPVERYGILSMEELLLEAQKSMQNPAGSGGVPTGIGALDKAIGKYRPGNITILGAKPSFGKTSFSIMNVDAAHEAGMRVLLFSCEDASVMYGKRFLAKHAGISAIDLRDSVSSDEDVRRAVAAVAKANKDPFFVSAQGRSFEWIAGVIKAVTAEDDISLVVVDYLQRIRAERQQGTRTLDIGYGVGLMTDAIKNAKSAGLFLSQLLRGGDTVPTIEQLKESAAIEEMGEHVLLGWKDTADGECLRRLKVAKNKDGIDPSEISEIPLEWDNHTASFIPTQRAQEGGDIFGGF